MVNLLIAMMANSYQTVQEQAVSYSIFSFVQTVYESDTSPQRLPAPFNILEALTHWVLDLFTFGRTRFVSLETSASTCTQIVCRWCQLSFCFCENKSSTCINAEKPAVREQGIIACPFCHRSVAQADIALQEKEKSTQIRLMNQGINRAKEFVSFVIFTSVLPLILPMLLFDYLWTLLGIALEGDSEATTEPEVGGGGEKAEPAQAEDRQKVLRRIDETLDEIHAQVQRSYGN